MGYYTMYTLEVKNKDGIDVCAPEATTCPHCGAVNEDYRSDDFDQLIQGELGGFGVFEDSCKWYEHEEDMKKFSLKYPDYLFTLRGEGEEAGDLWAKYFKNGKMQAARAKIEFAPFDESALR